LDVPSADLDNDEIQNDIESDGSSSEKESKFKKLINSIKSSRRNQIITAVVVVVLISIVSFLSFRKKTVAQTATQAMTQQEAPTFDSSEIVKKKSTKKKKKKIKYVDLYKQLESKELTPILRELSYKNYSFNVVQNGKQFDLQIDQDQIDDAKYLLAIKGMPSGTVKGYEIFDEASNLGVTEFDKRIRLIRALSGEMEKSIMEFDVVDFAYVEIVIPETRLFAVTQPPVTASILIKRKNGANINDETVYAIMQLVSNSVENLLEENISVVDTEGRVLSTGVLDRMNQKIAAAEKKAASPVTASVGNGKVIIPAIEDVVDWFQLKFNYETVLEKKAINQLNGVLPAGSYKAAVTMDLNSVSKTGAPNIKQIVTSVVVDDQFDEVELNDETMNQIKQAVAGAIGFVEGRDKIHISKANFLPKRDPQSDLDEKVSEISLPKDTLSDKIKRIARFWPIFGIGSLISSALIIIGLFIKSLITKTVSGTKSIVESIKNRKSKNDEEAEEVLDIDVVPEPEPLTEQEVINNLKSQSNFAKVIQLKAISTQELESVVSQLKEMVK
ncbi:MAG: flagellar M-ring protein FliF C-terminal domain-containing protein, partial [Candidatus Margulisiibacteriota bacterium]|nr:flagellar M-ring protein FliF C-terminal domain-containing protein [Candidatus Margulisiibacteriota bacterium]